MSGMYKLNWKDLSKGLITAFFSGAFTAVVGTIQTTGFDLFTANWHSILVLFLNGGVVGLAGYLMKNFFSNSQGQVFGKIG